MRQKLAFFIETSPSSGGAFTEVIYMIEKINNLLKSEIDITIISSSNEVNLKNLNTNIKILYFKMNFFERQICYLKNFNGFFQKLNFFKNRFESFLKKNGIDIIYFLGPYQYSLYLDKTDFIITVPDVSHRENIEFPEWGKSGNFLWKENILSKSLVRAIAVITNANVIKNKLIQYYGVEKNRVFIINHQPSSYISKANIKENEKNKKFKLPKNYVFYPANFLPHKNHKYIIDVIEKINLEYKIDLHAVLCGADKGYLQKIKNYTYKKKFSKNIIFLDFVENTDLSFLYSKSLALAMPTFSGPTNIPPWEAFKLEVPVLYSDIFDIKQVYGDAVYYIDPYEPNTMVDALIRLINSNELRQTLIQNGNALLKKNNFDKEIKPILEIIKNNNKIKKSWNFE